MGMSKLRVFGWAVGFAVCVLYVLNPGAGIFELIPDNLPFVGNLDEATAALLAFRWGKKLWGAWRGQPEPAPGAAPVGRAPSIER